MSPLRGILLFVSAVSLFVVMGSLVKAAVRIPPGEAVFFRAFCGLPVICVWLAVRGELGAGLRVRDWRRHAVRGIAGSMAMGLGFLGLKLIPLPDATAIRFATPILIVIFAALILGEKIRLIRVSAVAVGLVGVSIVMWPRLSFSGGDAAMLGAVVTLCSAALAALAQVFVKSMAGKERTTAIVFWFSSTAAALALLTIPFGWVLPLGIEWVYLIGAGLVGGAGQILITSSYRCADASTLAPFTYVSMIWALIIGYFVFAEVPTLPMLAGAALVIAAGVAIVLRERALGMQQTAERKMAGQGHP
ncbi:MAG: DMT family transporter [Rhodobacteraceae bacterium]|nr:DMT family transporter [Paracoccaceae bacterium]